MIERILRRKIEGMIGGEKAIITSDLCTLVIFLFLYLRQLLFIRVLIKNV